MAAFCAWNRLSASAPVMFCGVMPSLSTSCDHCVTAPTDAGSESIPWVASGLVTPPPFSQSRIGHIGIVLFSASAIPYCGELPPCESLTTSACHWAQFCGGPEMCAAAKSFLFQ